jgi:hypothetical protein
MTLPDWGSATLADLEGCSRSLQLQHDILEEDVSHLQDRVRNLEKNLERFVDLEKKLERFVYASAGPSEADLGAKRKRDDMQVSEDRPDLASVAKVVAEGNLAQHSLDRLKEMCKTAGLKVNGTKAVLAERLKQRFAFRVMVR